MMNKDVTIKKEFGTDRVPDYVEETPEEFRIQLEELVSEYLSLKDALVGTDPESAAPAAQFMLDKLQLVNMSLVQGEAHEYWMELQSMIQGHGQKIAESSDVEEQRNQFDFLSEAVINSLRAFGTSENQYYVQYCPMAKNSKGASWISMQEEIKNPYFGDKMMKCGSVKLEL